MDLVGNRYGRLVVQQLEPVRGAGGQRRWHCNCDCGGYTIAYTENLTRGHTQSCGCLFRESTKTHGRSRTPEYKIWNGMIQRCKNPKNPNFPFYGGRGIRVCDAWAKSFEAFHADMGDRPDNGHSIERRDVNGHYEPNNCYWATAVTQANNRRNSVRHEIHGVLMTPNEIFEKYGISPTVHKQRMKSGMSATEAVVKPLPKRRSKSI